MSDSPRSETSPPSPPPAATDESREDEAGWLRAVFVHHPQPMWVFDAQTLAFLDVNEAATRVYGWSREEFLRMTLEDIRPPAERPALHEACRARAAGIEPLARLWTHRRRDGRELLVEITAQPVVMGGRSAFAVVVQDVAGAASHGDTGRQAAEALAASERRFRAMFEQAAVGLAHIAPDGSWLQVNGRLCEILGYGREALVGRRFQSVTHPDDVARDCELLASVLNGELPSYAREKRYVRADGAVVWVQVTVALVRRVDGSPDYLVSVVEDIRSRKLAESALRESEARLRLALEAAQQGAFELDVRAGTFDLNGQSARMLGCEDLRLPAPQSMWLERIHADERALVRAAYRDCIAGRRPDIRVAYRSRTATGWRWVLSVGRVVERADDGKPLRVLGTNTDVTRERTMADALRKLSLAVEQSGEAIVITDTSGTIEYVNEAFARASGYAKDELVGSNPRLLKSGRTPPQTYRAMWSALAAGQPWQGEFVNRRKDGSEYLEAVSVTPVREPDGTITHYLGVKEDITQRRRDAEELARHRTHLESLVAERTAQLVEASRRAEAANEAKSRFLANMSHEIRTPMNGVLGAVEVLDHTPLDATQADLVRTIRESGRTLLGIIDDILDFSKIEADRMQLARAPVALDEVVEGVCCLFAATARERGVVVDAFVDPALPPQVIADEVRLRQILHNLVGNAVKFSASAGPGAGHVAVRATGSSPPGRLLLVVRDDGIGMSGATLAKLFEPFSQGEASAQRRFGGTGLGLAICRRLVAMMAGTIDVESAPGCGTTFTVTLPLVAADGAAAARPATLAGVACAIDRDLAHPPDHVRAYLEHAGAVVVEDPGEAASGAVRVRSRGPAAGDTAPCVVLLRDAAPAGSPAPGARVVAGAILRRSALIDAVDRAARGDAGVGPARARAVAGARAAAPAVDEARAAGTLLLVAEDDAINRKVILHQLALLGYAAEVARNGREALRLWSRGGHALLLTDLHMPLADGYTLARAIRRAEARTPAAPRLPIVALTANAIRGEAERALAAGFDAYLTKPLPLAALAEAIARYLGAGAPAPSAAPAAPEASPAAGRAPVLDASRLAALVADDPALVAALLHDYRTHALAQAEPLAAACGAGDATTAAALAHKLKSSSRSVGALHLGEVCEAVERTAKRGNAAALPALAAAVTDAAREVAAALARHVPV